MAEKIGQQDGITAFVNWLRKQPGVPARGPKYDPENLSTWPWPDKLERTLKTLKADHDSAILTEPEPPPPLTIPEPFNGNGMVLLEPTGGTEDIQAAKDAGFTYLLLNLNYVSGGNWDVQRQRAANLGLAVVPWARVLNAADSQRVEATAIAWDSPAVAHNLEAEATTTYSPSQLANAVAPYPAKPRAVITEPWMQNGAGWDALKTWVAMPEAFQNANPAFTPNVVVDHAHAEGMPLAVPLCGWGVWADAPTYVPPATYLAEWAGPFAVYNGDSKEPQYQEWKR